MPLEPSDAENEKGLDSRRGEESGSKSGIGPHAHVRETDAPSSPKYVPPSTSNERMFNAPISKPTQEALQKLKQRDRTEREPDKGGGMSSDPMSDEEPEVDDGTLSEVVRRPARAAGDLSEVADASPGITTEDLARDLETVAAKPGVPTERELLEEILRRVRRIEEQLGIGRSEVPEQVERVPGAFEGTPGYRHYKEHPLVRTPGSGESSKREE